MTYQLKGFEDFSIDEKRNFLLRMIKDIVQEDHHPLSTLSNATSFIMALLPDLNWAGFYFYGEDLYLGPFQGLPACTNIELGQGVCGMSLKKRETLCVPDVHTFPGHIACDSASNAELVIPIFDKDKSYGVLDLDSPKKNRFTKEDVEVMEEIVQLLKPVVITFLGED
ncbi:MAG: GAF domain-containing protein [Tissierellia bacterium]|nr:GAF domain-containing protein [Tissierellia bacterium]